jgi:DNA-binding SARP family transcriptional activator
MARFAILGPFELRDAAGAAVVFGSDRARTLLALLLLERDQVCSTESLIAGIWGEHPPESARKNLQTYAWRLRRLLEQVGAARLEGRRNGYILRVDRAEVDVDQFERLAADGERLLAAGAAAEASGRLSQALQLWRGQPLSDVTFGEPPQGELVRLTEWHMTVLEDRIEADLRCGQSAHVIPELRKLAREHPYRERLHVQLMLALAQCGRQVEALSVFSDIRGVLQRDFGMEPGPALQQIQSEILGEQRGDAQLFRSYTAERDLCTGGKLGASMLIRVAENPAADQRLGRTVIDVPPLSRPHPADTGSVVGMFFMEAFRERAAGRISDSFPACGRVVRAGAQTPGTRCPARHLSRRRDYG